MSNFVKLLSVAVAVTTALSFGSAHADTTNLVTNGDFQASSYGAPFANLSAWNYVNWQAGQGDRTYALANCSSAVHDCSDPVTNYLSQALATTAGNTYTLTFYLENLAGAGGNNFVNVYWDGIAVATGLHGQANTDQGSVWTKYSFSGLLGTTGGDTVEFRSGSDYYFILLDDVSVTENTPAVPEPSEPALLLAGLAVMSFTARARLKAGT